MVNADKYFLLAIDTTTLTNDNGGQMAASIDGVRLWTIGWSPGTDVSDDSVADSLVTSLSATNVAAEGASVNEHILIGLIQDIPDISLFTIVGVDGALDVKWKLVSPVSGDMIGSDGPSETVPPEQQESSSASALGFVASAVLGFVVGRATDDCSTDS